MVLLTSRTISAAVTPPYPYGEELVAQFLVALKLCWFPLLISTVAIAIRRMVTLPRPSRSSMVNAALMIPSRLSAGLAGRSRRLCGCGIRL